MTSNLQYRFALLMVVLHKKSFLLFICTSGVTGEAIACDILQQLTSWNLDLEFLRGQAFDEAGAW